MDQQFERINIIIKMLDNSETEFFINKFSRIQELKMLIYYKLDIPTERQRIIFRGHVLQDEKTLSEQNIENNNVLHLIARPIHNNVQTDQNIQQQQSQQDDEDLQQQQEQEELQSQNSQEISHQLRAIQDQIQTIQERQRVAQRRSLQYKNKGLQITKEQKDNDYQIINQSCKTINNLLAVSIEPQKISSQFILQNNKNQKKQEQQKQIIGNINNRGESILQQESREEEEYEEEEEFKWNQEVFDFDKINYQIGQWIDVKDTINDWLEGQIINKSGNKIQVHYNGWSERWDEWIELPSNRISPFRTYTTQKDISSHLQPKPDKNLDGNQQEIRKKEEQISTQDCVFDIALLMNKTSKKMHEYGKISNEQNKIELKQISHQIKQIDIQKKVHQNIKQQGIDGVKEKQNLNQLEQHRKSSYEKELDQQLYKCRVEKQIVSSQLAPILDRLGRTLIDMSKNLAFEGQEILKEEQDQYNEDISQEDDENEDQYNFQVPLLLTPQEIQQGNESLHSQRIIIQGLNQRGPINVLVQNQSQEDQQISRLVRMLQQMNQLRQMVHLLGESLNESNGNQIQNDTNNNNENNTNSNNNLQNQSSGTNTVRMGNQLNSQTNIIQNQQQQILQQQQNLASQNQQISDGSQTTQNFEEQHQESEQGEDGQR